MLVLCRGRFTTAKCPPPSRLALSPRPPCLCAAGTRAQAALAGTPAAPLAGVVTGCVSACVRVPTSVVKSQLQVRLGVCVIVDYVRVPSGMAKAQRSSGACIDPMLPLVGMPCPCLLRQKDEALMTETIHCSRITAIFGHVLTAPPRLCGAAPSFQLGLHDSAAGCIRSIVAASGVGGLFAGFRATVALDVFYAVRVQRPRFARRATSKRPIFEVERQTAGPPSAGCNFLGRWCNSPSSKSCASSLPFASWGGRRPRQPAFRAVGAWRSCWVPGTTRPSAF